MAALPQLVTVAQFRQLPESGKFRYELHYGEIVALTYPKARHSKLQRCLMLLLQAKLQSFGVVTMELPYRPLAEFDFRAADVAAVSHGRWDSMDPDDNLRGAPELMIEVKSPSNTKPKLRELVSLCLTNGSIECWIVDSERKSITVVRRDGSTAVYTEGQSVPLAAFGSDELPLNEVFAAR